MKDTHEFKAVKRGETFLAYLFFAGAGILLLFIFVITPFHPPPAPEFKGDIHMLILTGIFLALGTVAWRWRPHKSNLRITDKGLVMSSVGIAPLAETDVLWKEVAELRLNMVTNRGHNPKYLHVISQIAGSSAKKDHALVLNGLEASVHDVMNAILFAAEKNDLTLKGPRPDSAEGWVDGMAWTLSKA